MREQPLYGKNVHCSAQRSATDRRYWSCIIGALTDDGPDGSTCEFSADWYAVCDDFGNLTQVRRQFTPGVAS